MKIKFYSVVTLFTVAVAMLCNQNPVNSKIANSPPASSGNPAGNKTCNQSSCHTGNNVIVATNEISIKMAESLVDLNGAPDIDNTTTYTPGTTYFMALSINVTGSAYGFQIIGQDATNAEAGTFTVTNATKTQITTETSTQKKFMGHKAADNTKSWIFKWTAPTTDVGPITFYSAVNQANGNQDESGDQIYKTAITLNALNTSLNEIEGVSSFNVFPNPIGSNFAISFIADGSKEVNAALYSSDGALVNNLYSGTVNSGSFSNEFNVSSLPQGVYLLRVNSGNQSITKRVFKQ
jgi:hypothetical protein